MQTNLLPLHDAITASPDYCSKHEYFGRHCLDCSVESLARSHKLELTPIRQILFGGPLNVWTREVAA